MDGFKIVVDGFAFTDEKEAEKARQEEDSIRYVRDRLDMGNPRMVLEMYHKLLAEQVFETPVGLLYLRELQDYLAKAPELGGEDIEAIPLFGNSGIGQPGGQAKTPQAAARQQETLEWYAEKLEESRQQERLAEYRRRRAEERAKESRKHLRFSLLFALFMILVTAGVGAITMTDNNPNIINYENKIIEKYQDWEADLESREEIMKEKERVQPSQ